METLAAQHPSANGELPRVVREEIKWIEVVDGKDVEFAVGAYLASLVVEEAIGAHPEIRMSDEEASKDNPEWDSNLVYYREDPRFIVDLARRLSEAFEKDISPEGANIVWRKVGELRDQKKSSTDQTPN